jgi:hypothetical protein
MRPAPRLHAPNVGDLWPVWRLVERRVATLREIDEHWSIGDVLDGNETLDVTDDLASWARGPAPAG